MGALRGLPLAVGRRRAEGLLTRQRPRRLYRQADPQPVEGHGADRPVVRHDRPPAQADRARRAFFGARRDQPGPARASDPRGGAPRARRSSSRPMSSPMPSGCASGSRSSPRASSGSRAASPSARDRLRPQVRLRTRAAEGPWRAALPADAEARDGVWQFELPPSGIEPLAQGLARWRRGDRGIVDRAARPARRLRRDRRRPTPRARWRSPPTSRKRHEPGVERRDRDRAPRFRRHGLVADASCCSCSRRSSRSASAC